MWCEVRIKVEYLRMDFQLSLKDLLKRHVSPLNCLLIFVKSQLTVYVSLSLYSIACSIDLFKYFYVNIILS